MIYYISDLHFGHRNVLEMDGRPFETIEDMDEILIRLWNERVTEEDDVYIVGDFAYHNGYTATWYLRRLKGRKHLIIGNHDRHTLQDAKAMEYFFSVEKMVRVMDNGRTVSLCHFPVAEWNGKRYGGYHVHGHIHVRRDEVYEFMVYEPNVHVSIAGLPGMEDHTITCSSLSKTSQQPCVRWFCVSLS